MTLQPETILRDTVVLVPASALAGALWGGAPLAGGTLVVGTVVLANLWLWTRLSRAYLAAAASDESDPLVMAAVGFKSLITVPLFLGLTYLFGPVAILLGLGIPLLGSTLRIVYAVAIVGGDAVLPDEEVAP